MATIGKQMGALEPVDLREFWEDEARDFTPWLAEEENLARLSETLGIDLELEDTEVSVGPFKSDLVAKDVSSNARVIIENQLAKTDHDHLGKVITYASGLDAGMIIWIAKHFTDEHRQAIDFLNEKASPDLQCFAIEIQLWRIGGSLPAPQFRVVASPNDFSTIIDPPRKLSETQRLYLEFWTGFKEHCIDQGTPLRIGKPQPQHWLGMAVGRSHFTLDMSASVQKRRLGCEIYLSGANAAKAFHLLAQDKASIEAELGQLTWMELPAKQDCRIVLFKQEVNIKNKADLEAAFAWLKKQAESFHKTFSHRIKALPNLDEVDEPEADDEGSHQSEAE